MILEQTKQTFITEDQVKIEIRKFYKMMEQFRSALDTVEVVLKPARETTEALLRPQQQKQPAGIVVIVLSLKVERETSEETIVNIWTELF